jgi:hypothetical protein
MPYVPADPEREEEKDITKELYLMVMIFHRKFKGFRIGKRLVDMAKGAREKGKEWLRVDCCSGIEKDGVFRDGLARYYQRNGFVPVRPSTVRIEARESDWPEMLLEQRV